MQKILTAFSLNVKHIIIEEISFTHFFKNIIIKKSITSAFTFSREDLMFNTVLEMID